ncbi:MAG: hypothetical protein IMZ50_08000 [Candidatus Atribacteria bacterium]|nr:hypothetical protein [Candidatus Atribacteria bacterium]
MYAKIFNQVFDSSIAEDYTVRHIFMDLLVLADPRGVVDMTLEAIARRTNVPLEVVTVAMSKLCKPDPHSRSKRAQGRRLVPIADNRSWGWQIVNFEDYHHLKNEGARRDYMRSYMKRRRAERKQALTPVNLLNSDVKHVDVDVDVDVNNNTPPTPSKGVSESEAAPTPETTDPDNSRLGGTGRPPAKSTVDPRLLLLDKAWKLGVGPFPVPVSFGDAALGWEPDFCERALKPEVFRAFWASLGEDKKFCGPNKFCVWFANSRWGKADQATGPPPKPKPPDPITAFDALPDGLKLHWRRKAAEKNPNLPKIVIHGAAVEMWAKDRAAKAAKDMT